MAKMCKYWKKASCSVDRQDDGYEKYWNRYVNCPKNTDDKCQIIEKDKVIKAWAKFDRFGRFDGAHYCKKRDYNVICTITIKAKDWKKLKEAK